MFQQNTYKTSIGVALIFAATTGFLSVSADSKKEIFSPYVDEKGNISLPAEFRTSMTHLGSWFVPTGDASGFHDVYTEKESVEVFVKLASSLMVQLL